MSLENDFELCLEYAQMLESKRDQRTAAQDGIVFMQGESERLKRKVGLCTKLSIGGAIAMAFFVFLCIAVKGAIVEMFPGLIRSGGVFAISTGILVKTKKESDEFEARKPELIRQYTEEAEQCGRDMARIVEEIYSENLLDIVPSDYFSVAAIEFCLSQVRKRLASTASEAFRLLEAEIKRMEQMEYLEQMNEAHLQRLDDIKHAIDINTLVVSIENRNKHV